MLFIESHCKCGKNFRVQIDPERHKAGDTLTAFSVQCPKCQRVFSGDYNIVDIPAKPGEIKVRFETYVEIELDTEKELTTEEVRKDALFALDELLPEFSFHQDFFSQSLIDNLQPVSYTQEITLSDGTVLKKFTGL